MPANRLKVQCFNAWLEAAEPREKLAAVVALLKPAVFCCGAAEKHLKSDASKLSSKFLELYNQHARHRARVIACQFMSSPVSFSKHSCNARPSAKCGRPKKTFGEGSARTDRKRVRELTDEHPKDVLTRAAASSLYMMGQRNASSIVKALDNDPSEAKKIKKALSVKPPEAISAELGLAAFLASKMSVKSYKEFRAIFNQGKTKATRICTYRDVKKAMKGCLPEGIQVTSKSASVPIKSLIKHTLQRICMLVDTSKLNKGEITKCNFVLKHGGDGSSGHSTHKFR